MGVAIVNMLRGTKKLSALMATENENKYILIRNKNKVAKLTGVPGISPPRSQIPRDLALPARPPLGISPPPLPRPNDTCQRIFLYLDLATKKASDIWFGNLFDNGFARVRLRANVV